MNRKSVSRFLVVLMGLLLFTGCTSNKAREEAAAAGTTQTVTEEARADEPVLPADAKIGIAYTVGNGAFTQDFIGRMRGYLETAGVQPENIVVRETAAGEMAETSGELIGMGCSVLVVGNAEPPVAGDITKAAADAGVPVLYFGTDPGEEERKSWEEKKLRVSYVGGNNSEAAKHRADLIERMGFDKIDLNEDGEIGAILLGGEGEEGSRINRETLAALEERGIAVRVLDEEEDAEADEADAETDEADAQTDEADAADGTDEADAETDEADAQAADADVESEESEEVSDEAYRKEERQDAAFEETVAKMEEYGKALELIICADEDGAIGAWRAVSDQKRLVGHDVVILGQDASQEILTEVSRGNIAGTLFNDSMAQARSASDYVLAFLRGEEVPYETRIDCVGVTVDNAQEIMDVLSGNASGSEEEEAEEGEG